MCNTGGGVSPLYTYSKLCSRPTLIASSINFFFNPIVSLIFSCTPAYTFSQKRGTLHIAVGRISFIVFWISAGRKLIDKVHPIERHQQVHARSNT